MTGRGLLPLMLLLLLTVIAAGQFSTSSPRSKSDTQSTTAKNQNTPAEATVVSGRRGRRSNTKTEPPGDEDDDDECEYGDDDEDRNCVCEIRPPDPQLQQPCSNGDLKLPHLKHEPNVSDVSEMNATVYLPMCKKDTDDGNLPDNSNLSYLLQLMENKSGEFQDTENVTGEDLTLHNMKYSYIFTGLTPNTTYLVRVLLLVKGNGHICTADAMKVKNRTFTTPCPAPPKPTGLGSKELSTKGFKVHWKRPKYPEKCHLQYVVSVEKQQGSQSTQVQEKKITEQLQLNIDNLEPYTFYNVRVLSQGGESYSDYETTVVRTRPTRPSAVTNLHHVENSTTWTSITVEWSDPNLPGGELESFRVSWVLQGVTTGEDHADVKLERRYVINYLKPQTWYTIKVKAKNKEEERFGNESHVTAATTAGVPSVVGNLNMSEANVSSLNMKWEKPDMDTGIVTYYNVSLYSATSNASTASGSPLRNHTVKETQLEFDDLHAGTTYTVQIKACNKEACGDTLNKTVYTRPAPPSLKEDTKEVKLVNSTETTITINLPWLENPPGYHYVMVKRALDSQETKELKKEAERLLETELNKSTRRRRSTASRGTPSEMYITAVVKQESAEKRLQVTVGDNNTYGEYHNRPLEKDAAYWTLVATVTRSGPWTEKHFTPPKRFKAASSTYKFDGMWLATGMAAVVLLATMMAIVILRRRSRREAKALRVRIGDESPPLPASRPDPYFLCLDNHSAGRERGVPMWEASTGNHCHPGQARPYPVTEDIYANATLQVQQRDLEAYLLRAVMSAETKEEFAEVPKLVSNNTSASKLQQNLSKNRYRTNVTYDETRVVLPLLDNIPHTDYINANFIEGPGCRRAFIATQGPLDGTVGAFWRMLWHTQCSTVVMVANLVERGKVKVAQYWPDTQPLLAEGITVTPAGTTKTMDFVVRTFTVSFNSAHRKVTQYQYTAWPDHGVPQMAYGLAHMLKIMDRDQGGRLPITVHCSAGIGRTGTVVLALYLLQQLKARGDINPMLALSALRRGRGRLVENLVSEPTSTHG